LIIGDNDDDAGAGFHPHHRTAVDKLTDEFRQKVSVPGALTKPPVKPKQKVYLADDSTAEEIVYWLLVKGFSYRWESLDLIMHLFRRSYPSLTF